MHPTQMEYNSQRDLLELREYGRNVHKLAAYVAQVEDRDKRTAAAKVLISLMRQLNPTTNDNQESTQRLWDHLHQMTNFELDVDSDFPPPEPEMLHKKPQRLDPKRPHLKLRHYGRNLQLLVERAAEMEPGSDEQIDAVAYIGRLMKSFYAKGKKDNMTDEVILKELDRLAKGKIQVSLEKVQELQLFELPKPEKRGGGRRSRGRRKGRS